MNTHNNNKLSLAKKLLLPPLLLCMSIPANSQNQAHRTLEEVLVVAQKRQQAVTDVPISMSVLSEQFLADEAITDIRDAMLYVPNVKVEEAGFFSAPRARGFSFNNNNKAFEPPIGIAIDGIPYTRVPYFQSALFDIARIEVLRGPQGTTFGKNTTAGIIHVITKKPDAETSFSLDVQNGELGRERYELGVGIPLIEDVLNIRLAAFKDNRDGFVENTTAAVVPTADKEFRGRYRDGYRARFTFPDILGTELTLSYESVELTSRGTGAELWHVPAEVADVLRRYDPNVDLVKGNGVASMDFHDDSFVDISTFHAEWTARFWEWDITALYADSELVNEVFIDTDFSPAPAIAGHGFDKSPTQTTELRFLSPAFEGLFGLDSLFGWDPGSSDILLGIFHQKRGIEDSSLDFRFDVVSFLELTAAAGVAQEGIIPPEISALQQLIPLAPPGTMVDQVVQTFDQESVSKAFFAQAQWLFHEDWTLQLSGRFSREKKSARWEQVFISSGPNLALMASGLEEFSAALARTETQTQPKVSINWQPDDNISVFLHWTRAYKGGGFNAFAFRNREEELTFEPEITEEIGADFKLSLFDDRARLNLSLYRMDVDDFQVLTRLQQSTTVGLGVSAVENAAKARAQGVEADMTWLAGQHLTLIATLGYNDTEYLDFPSNECAADRPNTDGDDDNRCDASGEPFPFAPRWTSTLTGNLRFPVFDSLELSLGMTAEYQSEQLLDLDLDPRKEQEAFTRYKASIGLGNPSQGWRLRIVGENLGNESTSIRAGDVFPGVFVSAPESPRLIFAQFNWQY